MVQQYYHVTKPREIVVVTEKDETSEEGEIIVVVYDVVVKIDVEV